MILGERGLVPRHKMLEKLVKGRRGGREISRGKVERRNIRHTSGRTRLNERESCRSTGFLYFSARFCARFKRLHARATPQMSCYSKLADERLESRCIEGRSRPSPARGQNGTEPRIRSFVRGYWIRRKMDETKDLRVLTTISRSNTDYGFFDRIIREMKIDEKIPFSFCGVKSGAE